MTTINISLPEKLKSQAEELIEKGFYASFSDIVRHSLRNTVSKSRYDLLTELAIEEEKQGKLKVLKTPKDIDNFVKSLYKRRQNLSYRNRHPR